jgi:hypothetical protein
VSPELRIRKPRTGSVEHLWRAVHADDLVSLCGRVLGVTPGAAGRVEDCALRERVENLVHERLVIVEQAVASVVVRRRPLAVSGQGVASADHHPRVIHQRVVGQQLPHLGDALLDKFLVVVAGLSTQQRNALKT